MKKTLLGIFFSCVIFLSLSFAIAGEISELSKKASNLKLGMTRDDVIVLLGKPKWAVIPNDKGKLALSNPKTKLELYWQNPNYNPVVVQFNGMLKVSGWDEGRAFCGKDAHLFEPSEEYSCKKPDRAKFCKSLLTTPASRRFLVTIVKKANVREGPGTHFRIVGQTVLGEISETPKKIIFDPEKKWVPLGTYPPYKKWIHKSLVNVFENQEDAVVFGRELEERRDERKGKGGDELKDDFLGLHLGCSLEELEQALKKSKNPITLDEVKVMKETMTYIYLGNHRLNGATRTTFSFWNGKLTDVAVFFLTEEAEKIFDALKIKMEKKYAKMTDEFEFSGKKCNLKMRGMYPCSN